MYKFVKDTVEEIPSDKEEKEIWGEFKTLKVKETGEELYVFDKPDEIEVCKKKGNSFKRIAHIKITDGYIHDFKIDDETYRGIKLGDYLFRRAVKEYNGWELECGGTIAYKLYRKYDFVPLVPKRIGSTKSLSIVYANAMRAYLEGEKELPRIIPMVRRDRLQINNVMLDRLLKKFTEYVDAHYHGVYDSVGYTFERVNE